MVFFLAASWALARLDHQRHFDLVHIHSLPDFQVFSTVLERLHGVRVVLDLHEAMPELFAARFHLEMRARSVQFARVIERLSCMYASHVLVVNETLLERLMLQGIPSEKVTIVMNSPPLDSLEATEAVHISEKLQLSGMQAIVYVGGINQERDLDTLVRAVALLRESHPLKLVIVGHGDERYKDSLRRLSERVGLTACHIGDQVPHWEAFSYMTLSAIGPITYERNPLTEIAMPSKALEYVAAGKPLVMADLPAVRRIFGNAAVYYQSGNCDDLARKIAWLLEHHSEAREMVQEGSRILKECGWDVMSARLRTAYGLGGRLETS
jgi:glycosyltransferase involved in cell wall biosynthesis